MKLHKYLEEMMRKAKPVRVIGYDPEEPELALDGTYSFLRSREGQMLLRKSLFEKGGRRFIDFSSWRVRYD